MALVINTNIASITAQNNAVNSRRDMETAMERLSSGLRINSAKDDAAGMAISNRLESQIRGMTKAVQNANDAISLAQTAEGAQQEIEEMLQRIRELAVQSTNSSNTAVDRESLDSEVQQLLEEIDQIAATTKFNNQKLLDGSFEANIQIGDQLDQQMSFGIASMRTSTLGLGSASSSTSNVLVGARVEVDASTGALLNASSALLGDVLINGQELGSLATAEDIQDIVKVVNDTIDNVTASAFNTVVANAVGDGVTSAGDITITVRPTTVTDDTNVASEIAFTVGEASSMDELVAAINQATQGYVTASKNDDGKLVLENDTGASIKVTDTSEATGFKDYSGKVFAGMLRLESTDGSDIRIERSFNSTSSANDLEVLGFRQIGTDDGYGTAYSVLGDNLTAAQATAAFAVNDLKINGIDVYNVDITSTSIAGKIESINSVSDETGVSASAYFEKYYDLSTAVNNTSVAGATVTINGVDLSFGSVASLVANINTNKNILGISAENDGDVVRLFGNVNSVTVSYTGHSGVAAAASLPFGTAGTAYAGIKLDSIDDQPFSIDLGDSSSIITTATSAGSSAFAVDYLGFKEMNVGAADFASNAPTIGAGGGQSISGLSVASVVGANAAIASIDRALEQVSASAASLGAIQNRLGHTINNLQETVVNTNAARSRIEDADYAVESANLAKQQVLQQAATAMLAQANASTQSVLTLLGG
jgi:flagellin